MNMVAVGAGNAVSAGVGLGLGLVLVPCMYQAMAPRVVKPVIVCLYCRGRNPEENKFCGHCGRSLYPAPRVQCPKCGVNVLAANFCENCGSKLRE